MAWLCHSSFRVAKRFGRGMRPPSPNGTTKCSRKLAKYAQMRKTHNKTMRQRKTPIPAKHAKTKYNTEYDDLFRSLDMCRQRLAAHTNKTIDGFKTNFHLIRKKPSQLFKMTVWRPINHLKNSRASAQQSPLPQREQPRSI